jgi:hypothetical protein
MYIINIYIKNKNTNKQKKKHVIEKHEEEKRYMLFRYYSGISSIMLVIASNKTLLALRRKVKLDSSF